MAEQEPFKLGELSSFQLPSVEARTSTRLGDDNTNSLFNADGTDNSTNTRRVQEPRGATDRKANEQADFGRAFDSAVEGLKATGHGALAAVGTAVGFNEFADAEIKASEANQKKADRLAHGLITDIGDVEFDKGIGEGLGDLTNYFINGAGTLTPSILEGVTAAVAGAAVGSALPGAGTVAGGIAGGVARIAGKKKLQSLVKEYVATQGFKKIAGQSAKRQALNLRKKKIVDDSISRFYQTVGTVVNSQALGTGEIFNEAISAGATKEEASTVGLVGGVPFGLLDAVLPSSIIQSIGRKAVGGRFAKAGQEALEGFLKEGATETAQEEILIRTKEKFDDDFDISGEEASSRRLNSFILGGFAGGALGGVSGALQPQKIEPKNLTTPVTNVDFTSNEVRSSYSRLRSFVSTNERFTALLGTDRDQVQVNKILNESAANISNLKAELTTKFLSEENKDTASKAEAKEVIQAIDTHTQNQAKAKSQAEEVSKRDAKIETAQTKKAEQSRINPEYKHIDGIQERVLGIAEGLDIELTKSELKGLTKTVQDRLFKFEDQSVPADEAISDLKLLIKEDIFEVERAREEFSDFEEVARRQQAQKKAKKKAKKSKREAVKESVTEEESTIVEQGQEEDDILASLQRGEQPAFSVKQELAEITAEDRVKAESQEQAEVQEIEQPLVKEIKQKAQVEVLPKIGNPSKANPKRTPTKRTRKTLEIVDVNDEGTVDVSALPIQKVGQKRKSGSIPGVLQSISEEQQKNLKVQVLSSTARTVTLLTETIGGNNYQVTLPLSKFNSSKKTPTLQDKQVNQVEVTDRVREERSIESKPKKIVTRTKRKKAGVTLEEEVENLASKKNLTNEDIARIDEIDTQLDQDKSNLLTNSRQEILSNEITDEDIALDKKLAAVDKEISLERRADTANALPVESIDRLSDISVEIGSLQDAKSVLDPEFDKEARQEIQTQIAELRQERVRITGIDPQENSSQIHLKQKAIRSALPLGNETDPDSLLFNTDDVVITSTLSGGTISTDSGPRILNSAGTPETLSDLHAMVDRVNSHLKSSAKENIRIVVVNSHKEYVKDMRSQGFQDDGIGPVESFSRWKGQVATLKGSKKRTVYLNATSPKMSIRETATATLMHELVGHVGLSKVFGDRFRDFKLGLLRSNAPLRNDILKLSKRWRSYTQQWEVQNPNKVLNNSNSLTFKDQSTGKTVRIPLSVSSQLAEEYLSELSAIKMIDGSFKVNSSLREGFIKRVVSRLMHLSRSLFGKFNSGINEEDMLSAIAASADVLFTDPDNLLLDSMRPDVLEKELRDRSAGIGLDHKGRLKVTRNLELGILSSPEDRLSAKIKQTLTQDEAIWLDTVEDLEVEGNPSDHVVGRNAANAMGANQKVTEGVARAVNNGYGKLNESSRIAWINQVGRNIRNNPMAQKFFSLGNLPYETLYNSIQAITKGKLGKLESLSRKVNTQFSRLSAFQKEQVYSFFTTRFTEEETNVQLESLRGHGISEETIGTILESKGTIESLGQQLVDLNMLNPESFEENRGSYLPTRYLKYLFTNPGGGKKTSLLNFLKKDGNLDEDTKALLGEIKDPSFLVAETIGMIGRDTAILQMLDSLANNGKTGATSWVLNSEDFVTFRGKGRSQVWLQEEIARVETILNDHNSDTSGAFQLNRSQLEFNQTALTEMRQAEIQAEQAILDRLGREAKENGQGDIDPVTYRDTHYTKMERSRRNGKLSGLWVRKEIANDLKGVLQSFDVDPNDPIAQWFGGNGKLVRANSYWKMLKVPFNLPSWFRNGVGNMTLLDISTNTSMPALTKMYHSEVSNAIRGEESRYWLMAVDNGLFGTTYAAAELYGLRRDFDKRFKVAARNQDSIKGSTVSSMFEFMNDQFLTASDYASRGFGLLEGSFKTVAMRDFIQQWESQNESKIDSLGNDQREAVIQEAVRHANNALFDYSQVPSFINFARRYPLGAPFITFMYKSFPVVIEAMAKRPQKFIKYAAFPMIMSMLAQSMNDWSDDDVERLKASMPQWTRDRSSVFLFPFKDANDRPQFADYSYALPWSPFIDAGLKIHNHFEANNIAGAVNSTLALGQDITDDLGFLGGPLSTTITAWKSNKDSFTGRTIINEGDNPSKKVSDMSKWLWNMAMPSFVTSHGFLGKLYDDIGISLPGISAEPLDSFGKDKNTAGQIAGNLSGFQTRGFDPQNTIQKNLRGFDRRMIEINKSRSTFLKDPNTRRNPQERASGLREFNARRKLLLKERADFLNEVRG